MSSLDNLTIRERQVMEILYAIGEGTVNDVIRETKEPPSYSAIRAILSRLVKKGLLNYFEKGPRYIYSPSVEPNEARQYALEKVVDTFYNGSTLRALDALMSIATNKLSQVDMDELEDIIYKARRAKGKLACSSIKSRESNTK